MLQVQAVLAEVPPELHAAVWFSLYRLFGDREYAVLAKERGLPATLPYFEVPPA